MNPVRVMMIFVGKQTALRVSFCFSFDAHLWVPSFKNTASIFPEISFNQYFPLFSCKQYDVITDLICIIENVNISKTKKDIS